MACLWCLGSDGNLLHVGLGAGGLPGGSRRQPPAWVSSDGNLLHVWVLGIVPAGGFPLLDW